MTHVALWVASLGKDETEFVTDVADIPCEAILIADAPNNSVKAKIIFFITILLIQLIYLMVLITLCTGDLYDRIIYHRVICCTLSVNRDLNFGLTIRLD